MTNIAFASPAYLCRKKEQNMPTNKNAFQRYVYLDPLLADQYHHYDIHDLKEHVNRCLRAEEKEEVGERMIQKDIKALEGDPFYIDIRRYRENGKSCICYADPTFSIFNKKLTDDEKNLLKELLNTLGQFEGLDSLSWFDDLKKRLKLENKQTDAIIQFETNPRTTDSNLLGSLFTAIAHKQVIRIFYRKFDEVREKSVVLHPYLLKQFNTRWYVFGADDGDNFLLHFALERITRIEPQPTAIYRECEHSLVDRFEDIVGVTLNRNKETGEPLSCDDILIWADENEIGYIETKPLHGSQIPVVGDEEQALRKRYPHLNAGRFYRLECIPNRELFQAFAAYFSGIELLEPLSLRKEYAEIISLMNKKYL